MENNNPLESLAAELQALQEKEAEIKKSIGAVKDEILKVCDMAIKSALLEKDEPFGAVNIGPFLITTPKKIEWDQTQLANLYKEIGETAHEYMDVQFKVRETAFKNWPSAIQNAFIPARTVSTGSIQIKVKE